MEAVFVAEREVVKEVFDGGDAAFGEAGSDAVADALDELDGCGELERHGIDGSSGVAARVLRNTLVATGGRADEMIMLMK